MANTRRQVHTHRSGVVICGAYGHGNAGDEAILEAIIASLRELDANLPITVLSRTPEQTAKRHGVQAVHSFDLKGMKRALSGAQVYLNGGGSLIQDVTSRRSLWYYLYTLRKAKRLGCRVIMYGCGIGPVTRGMDVSWVRRVLNSSVDCITLREENSLAELDRFGVTKPRRVLSADPALRLRPAPAAEVEQWMTQKGMDPNGKYLCFCLRSWEGFAQRSGVFSAAARYGWEKYGLTPVFLSINRRSDGDAADLVCQSLRELPHFVLRDPPETGVTMGLLSRMAALVSMRLHGLIFAAGQGTPLVGVSYDPKVDAFLQYVGQPRCLALEDLETERLCAMIEQALHEDPAALRARAQSLRDVEHRNVDCVRQMLEQAE